MGFADVVRFDVHFTGQADPAVITYWDMRDQRITLVGDTALVGATNRWVRVRDGAEAAGMTSYTDTYLRTADQ